MNVLVLISGIADPRWPLPATPDLARLRAHAAQYAILGPFDEAALEVALKLRDADPATTIAAVVAGPEALTRKVAELRLDTVQHLATTDLPLWDARAFAGILAEAVAPLAAGCELVLAGREFGDFDDGSVPALLAAAMARPMIAPAVGAERRGEALWASRQRGSVIERVRLDAPALLAVTNDSHNRLRHPLLKNVMAARRLQFETLASAAPAARVALAATAIAPAPQRATACRMLTGSANEQSAALAALLLGEEALP